MVWRAGEIVPPPPAAQHWRHRARRNPVGGLTVSVQSRVFPNAYFGRLRVAEDTGQRQWGQIVWRCLCDCGSEAHVVSAKLTNGQVVSCGCYRRALIRERNSRTRDDLSRRVAETVSKNGLRLEPIKQEVTWRTKLTLTCPTCGHKRHTDVAALLKKPAACRRCSKRIPAEKLRAMLSEKMIALGHVEYPSMTTKSGQGTAYCNCLICHQGFQRKVGELVSGNRGCPHCKNVQEMFVRVILSHNLKGTFAIRKRPPWMRGLELDGWNTEIAINGQSVAFEYMGRYWHKNDETDRAKIEGKSALCAQNDVILLVVWALADRPSWEQQLSACQKAVDHAALGIHLEMPPTSVRDQLAKAVPREVRDKLAAINHEALEYDLEGNVRSLCRISGKEVSQAAYSLKNIRGCKFCQGDPSNATRRRTNALKGARAMWDARRAGKQYSHIKITDEIVAYIRSRTFASDDAMAKDVDSRFGIKVSPSGLQYARCGRTHSYLNEQYPPVRKSASPYKKDHPAVLMARTLRETGLSLGRISTALFDAGYKTLSGNAFSATQVKLFVS